MQRWRQQADETYRNYTWQYVDMLTAVRNLIFINNPLITLCVLVIYISKFFQTYMFQNVQRPDQVGFGQDRSQVKTSDPLTTLS